MAEITASMVRDLREKTDAPMMECKKALTEAAGDLARAEEILRVKLGNKASKAASRVAAEGLVATHIADDVKLGAILEINCETDFVAKNADFQAYAGALARLVAEKNPADVAALSALDLKGTSVEATRTALIGKIGENVSIRRFVRVAAKGKLASYIHGGSKIGVLVDVVGGDDTLAKNLAMQIAASKPLWLTKEEVPAELIQKERDIAAAKEAETAVKEAERAAESGKPTPKTKPANIVEKIIEGSAQKYLKEVALLGQPFVKNDKQTVEQLLKANHASVASFTLYVVGEGLEKKKDDFAAEVMAAVTAANK